MWRHACHYFFAFFAGTPFLKGRPQSLRRAGNICICKDHIQWMEHLHKFTPQNVPVLFWIIVSVTVRLKCGLRCVECYYYLLNYSVCTVIWNGPSMQASTRIPYQNCHITTPAYLPAYLWKPTRGEISFCSMRNIGELHGWERIKWSVLFCLTQRDLLKEICSF